MLHRSPCVSVHASRSAALWVSLLLIAPACAGRATSLEADAGESPPEGNRSLIEASAKEERSADGTAGGAATSDGEADRSAQAEGWAGAAKVLGVGWSRAVTARCLACNGPDDDGCLREDGSLVPSPFQLICLTQLAQTDLEVQQYLDERVQAEQSDIDRWARVGCADVISLPDPLPVPERAQGCFARDFTCPEQRHATACDGKAECVSGEDERFCGVIAPTFVCHHGTMLAWSRVCDGVPDCEFQEDEANCYARPAP